MKNRTLDQLKKEQPFRVPDGYLEGLTNRIMEELPESSIAEMETVSLLDRIRPWLYLAAVFMGLGLFFKVIVALDVVATSSPAEELIVQSGLPISSLVSIDEETAQEDADYLEYMEDRYTDYLYQESLAEFE